MNALWQIILQILWRLRPVSALEMNLHDIIALGFQIFTSDEELDDLAHNPARRAIIAPALADAHAKLNLLIYLRACELAGLTPRSTRFIPNFTCTHASTDTLALWRAFQRLVAKFDDYERLAKLRAQHLRREASTIPPSLRDSPLRLDAAHRSTSPAFHAVEDSVRLLEVLPRRRRGRWIGASSRRDG